MSEPESPPGERAEREPESPPGGDAGTAVVEFVLLGVMLLVPLLYLALALSAVQRTAYGVTQAAREAGRGYVTGTVTTAAPRAEHAARLAPRATGLAADGVEIRYGSAVFRVAPRRPAAVAAASREDFAVS